MHQRRWIFTENTSSTDLDILSQCRSVIAHFDETVVTVIGRALEETTPVGADGVVFAGRCSEFDTHFSSFGGGDGDGGAIDSDNTRFVCFKSFETVSSGDGGVFSSTPIPVLLSTTTPAVASPGYSSASQRVLKALSAISVRVILCCHAVDEAANFHLSRAGIVVVSLHMID